MPRSLEEFAQDNIHKIDSFNRNLEYAQALKYACKHEETLFAKLNDENKALLKKFLELNGEVIRLTATDSFIHGYRLDLMMTSEAFTTAQ